MKEIKMITLPNRKRVTLGQYVEAWRRLKRSHPDQEFEGWNWWPMKARDILRDYRRAVHDRINIRQWRIDQKCETEN